MHYSGSWWIHLGSAKKYGQPVQRLEDELGDSETLKPTQTHWLITNLFKFSGSLYFGSNLMGIIALYVHIGWDRTQLMHFTGRTKCRILDQKLSMGAQNAFLGGQVGLVERKRTFFCCICRVKTRARSISNRSKFVSKCAIRRLVLGKKCAWWWPTSLLGSKGINP